MISFNFLALSGLALAASSFATPVAVNNDTGNVAIKMKKRGDAPCATKFDFLIQSTGPVQGGVPSVGYFAQMTSDGDDYIAESSTCYLLFGGGCKWLNPGVATIQVGGDHYDFTHADYGFSTGQDLTGKTISWTVEGCADYSCTLESSTTTIIDPRTGTAFPMTITACRDGTKAPDFFTEQIAGEAALSIARDCTSDTDEDCNTTYQYTNIQ